MSVKTISVPAATGPSKPDHRFNLSFVNLLWLLLIALPPLLLLVELVNYTLQVPFLDEFLFAPLVVKLHTGGFTLADFWNQHNEHRIIVWRTMALALAKVGGYSVPKETLVGYGFALLNLLVVWRLVRRSVEARWVGPVMIGCSWLIFSAIQWQNWSWGFQPPWFLVNLLVLLAVLLLSYRPVKRSNFWLAVGLTIVASYTTGSALPLWPTVLVGFCLDWRPWRWKYLAGWLVAGLGTAVLYLYQYDPNPENGMIPDKTYFLKHLPETTIFVLNYLGAPLALWNDKTQGAAWFGLVMLGLVGLSAGYLWWQTHRDPSRQSSWQRGWPWLVISLFALFNAGLTAVSRVGLGLNEALSSRYTSVSLWFWIGGAILIGLAIRDLSLARHWKLRRSAVAGLVGLTLLLAISFGVTYAAGWQDWQNFSTSMNQTRPFFYEYEEAPADVMGRLFVGDSNRVRNLAWLLNQYHEGPFLVSQDQYRAEQSRQWQANIKDNNYQSRIYSPTITTPVLGDGSSMRNKGDRLSFTHTGKETTNIEFDLSKFYAATGQPVSTRPPLVEIQLESAQFVRVMLDTGKGFNPGEQVPLTAALEKDGRRYFRLELPAGIKRFRVDAMYRVARTLNDSLQVSIYTKGN